MKEKIRKLEDLVGKILEIAKVQGKTMENLSGAVENLMNGVKIMKNQ